MDFKSEKSGYDSVNRVTSPTEIELTSYLASLLPSHPPPAYTRTPSQLQSGKPLLPRPICLPQLSSGGRQSDFLWADARDLRDLGIGKDEWARFLRGLEVARNGSGTFKAVDMMGVGIKLIPLPFVGLAGSALTSLASSSKSALTRSTVDNYLTQANNLLFDPRGLQVQIFTTKGLEEYLKVEHEKYGAPEGYTGKGKPKEGPTATQKFGRGVGKFAMHVPIVAAFAHPIVRAIADDPSKRSSTSGTLSPLASKYQTQTTPFAAHHLNRLEGAIAELELGADYFPADCGLTEGEKRGEGTWAKMNAWRVQRKREMNANVSGRSLRHDYSSSSSDSSDSSDSESSDDDRAERANDPRYARRKMERDMRRAKKRQRRLESQEEKRQRRARRATKRQQRRLNNKDITENWRLDKDSLWVVVINKDDVSQAIAHDLYPTTSPTSPPAISGPSDPMTSSHPIPSNDELPAYSGKGITDGDQMMKDDVRGLFEKRA